MNATYNDGAISFDFRELLQMVPPDKRVALIEDLACEDAVIKHVANQILEGWTEGGCHGATACTASANPNLPLDEARRKVAKLAGDVAAEQIKVLERALAAKETELQAVREEMHRRRQTYA